MPAFIERALTLLLLGLWPPVPLDLRSDYAIADAAEQAEMRQRYASRLLRWKRVVAAWATIMLIKWMWEFGWLAVLGFGSGVATGGEIDALRKGQADAKQELMLARAETRQFVNRYEKDILESKLRSNAAETYQVETAISDAYRAGRVPDGLHQRRLSDLKSEKTEIERRLAAIERLEELGLRNP